VLDVCEIGARGAAIYRSCRGPIWVKVGVSFDWIRPGMGVSL
jgi:hypothetical protein